MIAQSATKCRTGIGLVAVCVALLISGCAAGQRAQTAIEKPAIDGTSGAVGSIQLEAVAIKSAPGAPSYQPGDAAELQVVLVNTGHAADTLQGVSSPAVSDFRAFATSADASAAISPPASSSVASSSRAASTPASSTSASSAIPPHAPVSLVVPAGQSLSLGVLGTDAVLLVHLTRALFSGMSVPITFTFANAGSVTLVVPIRITDRTSPAGVTVPPPSGSSGG